MEIVEYKKELFEHYKSMRLKLARYERNFMSKDYANTNKIDLTEKAANNLLSVPLDLESKELKEDDYIFLLKEDSVYIGYINFRNLRETENRYSMLYIETLFIEEEYRGKGCGKKLMEIATKYAEDWKVRSIKLGAVYSNEQAMNFYKKLGFNILGCNLGKRIN